ncbi:MAG TPA: hypothetical protein PKH77_24830 [Anaerolineae bacterium]|nr:hypothetical protein [Anaerolineae bacterium]
MTRLTAFTETLSRSAWRRHLLFALCTLVTLLFIGYYFGTFDQVFHIPFLKKFADPTLYPNDPFFEMRFQHYSYFWFLWIPFYRLGVLEITLFIAHILVTYLTFWAIWLLCEELFHTPLTSFLSTVAFVVPRISFGGFPLFEFSLLNRTFVFPFLLLAILLYLRRRYLWAYLLLGVLYNLHVISVNFVMGMFLFDSVLQLRRVGWRNLALGLALFLAGAAPVLIWKFSGPPAILAPQREWFSEVSKYIYQFFYPLGPYLHVITPTLNGFCGFVLVGIALHRGSLSAHDRTLIYFLGAVLIIVVVQIVAAWVYPSTFLMQLQIIRAGVFATLFSYPYLIHYLVKRYQTGDLPQSEFQLLLGGALSIPFTLTFLLFWGILRWIRTLRQKPALCVVLIALITVGNFGIASLYNVWRPGIHIFGVQDDWTDVQLWAREHTPRDAIFISPPQKWDFYESDWRVFSERSAVVTFTELLEIGLVPSHLPEWQTRFEKLVPGARAQFTGDFFHNRALTADIFYTRTAADLQAIAQEYGATYLVVEKPHTYAFPVIYENDGYIVYTFPAP